MGCFTFLPKSLATDTGTPILSSCCKCLTLTSRGVALLADCGLLPDINKRYLNDKSRSDGLSKFIACVQAAWLIVQVVGRLILGLQVTLLEVNTLAQVFGTLIIYVLWWHKPRMVQEPINLDRDWLGPLCAYMYMSSSTSGQAMGPEAISNDANIEPEVCTVALFPEEPCKYAAHGFRIYLKHTSGHLSDTSMSIRESKSRTEDTAYLSPNIRSRSDGSTTIRCATSGCFGPRAKTPRAVKDYCSRNNHLDVVEEARDSGAAQAIRWCLAAKKPSLLIQRSKVISRQLYTPCPLGKG